MVDGVVLELIDAEHAYAGDCQTAVPTYWSKCSLHTTGGNALRRRYIVPPPS